MGRLANESSRPSLCFRYWPSSASCSSCCVVVGGESVGGRRRVTLERNTAILRGAPHKDHQAVAQRRILVNRRSSFIDSSRPIPPELRFLPSFWLLVQSRDHPNLRHRMKTLSQPFNRQSMLRFKVSSSVPCSLHSRPMAIDPARQRRRPSPVRTKPSRRMKADYRIPNKDAQSLVGNDLGRSLSRPVNLSV